MSQSLGMKRVVARIPVVGKAAGVVFRSRLPVPFVWRSIASSTKWLFKSRETTNYTYDLTDRNLKHLAALVSVVTKSPIAEIRGYIDELRNDQDFARHVVEQTRASGEGFKSDSVPRFGRRLGWYAFVRAIKPRVVVETGVDKGLGACVLCAALLKNRAEGHEGRYYGTDIDPRAGYLLSGRYKEAGQVLYGDSIESLNKLDAEIDLFINDSDHSAEYEGREYEVVEPKLSQCAIILGDNSHVTDKLMEFAERTGRRFIYFREDTGGFWFPGSGIGVAYTEPD
jgi:predicted O-methyltransferase YrrM